MPSLEATGRLGTQTAEALQVCSTRKKNLETVAPHGLFPWDWKPTHHGAEVGVNFTNWTKTELSLS